MYSLLSVAALSTTSRQTGLMGILGQGSSTLRSEQPEEGGGSKQFETKRKTKNKEGNTLRFSLVASWRATASKSGRLSVKATARIAGSAS